MNTTNIRSDRLNLGVGCLRNTLDKVIQMYGLRKIRNFLDWFLKELIIFRKVKVIQAIIFDALNVLLQTGGYAGLMIYLKHLHNGNPIRFMEYELHLSKNISVTIIVSFIFCMLLAAAGFCMYKGRTISANLARLYEEYTLCKMYQLYVQPNLDKSFGLSFYENKKDFQAFAARAPNYLGRIYMEVISSLVPIIAMMVSFFLMVYLEPIFTIIIIFILFLSIPIYLYLNKIAYKSSEGLKNNAKGYSFSKANSLEKILASPVVDGPAFERMKKDLLSQSTKDFLDSYEIRLKITHMSLMVTNYVGATIFFILFCFMVYKVNYSNYNWFSFLFFAIPLKYFLSGLRASFKMYTKFYTFLPYFEPYLFMSNSDKPEEYSNRSEDKDYTEKIIIKIPDYLTNKEEKIIIRRDTPINVIAPQFLSRFSTTPLVYKLNEFSLSNSYKIKNFCILNENIHIKDIFRVFEENYSELLSLSKKISDYQTKTVIRLRERIDKNEILTEKKINKIWSHFSPEIRIHIVSSIGMNAKASAYFLNANQFDLLTHKMAWKYLRPNAFFFIYSKIDKINIFLKNINRDYQTLININSGIYFFNPNENDYFKKALLKNNLTEKKEKSITHFNTVDDDFID